MCFSFQVTFCLSVDSLFSENLPHIFCSLLNMDFLTQRVFVVCFSLIESSYYSTIVWLIHFCDNLGSMIPPHFKACSHCVCGNLLSDKSGPFHILLICHSLHCEASRVVPVKEWTWAWTPHLWMTGVLKASLLLSPSLIALLNCPFPILPRERWWQSVPWSARTGSNNLYFKLY